MLLTKVISTVPRALLRPISKQRCRRRKGPRWSVRRALPQAIGSLIHPDLSCGAVALPEDLTPRRLSSPCWGTEGSNPACSSGESPANLSFRRIEVQGRSRGPRSRIAVRRDQHLRVGACQRGNRRGVRWRKTARPTRFAGLPWYAARPLRRSYPRFSIGKSGWFARNAARARSIWSYRC